MASPRMVVDIGISRRPDPVDQVQLNTTPLESPLVGNGSHPLPTAARMRTLCGVHFVRVCKLSCGQLG